MVYCDALTQALRRLRTLGEMPPVGAGGINAAIDDLHRTHRAAALRRAYLLSRDQAGAEDVVQDAFTRILGRLRGIRDPEALGGYLNRTIVNLARTTIAPRGGCVPSYPARPPRPRM